MDKLHILSAAGAVFMMTVGTAMHYLYAVLPFTWPVAPVDETPWEHLKLIFWPAVFFLPAEYYISGLPISLLASAEACAVLISMCFVLLAFYIYVSVIGKNVFYIDITIFILACCITYPVQNAVLMTHLGTDTGLWGYAALTLMAIVFTWFTRHAPWKGKWGQ